MKRFVVICICSALPAFFACKKSETPAPELKKQQPSAYKPFYQGSDSEAQVKNVIRRYNEFLIYGYKNLNMNPLHEVAAPEVAEKAYYHMAAIGNTLARNQPGRTISSRVNEISSRSWLLPH